MNKDKLLRAIAEYIISSSNAEAACAKEKVQAALNAPP